MGTVLVIGSGGREHAIVRALAEAPSQPQVFAAPGNPGIANLAKCLTPASSENSAYVALAKQCAADLVIVGPEAPLVAGLADALREQGIAVFGPDAAAAQLEGSKAFAKALMDEAQVPTAAWQSFSEAAPAIEFAQSLTSGAVIKADGLAAGKGVVVATSQQEAAETIQNYLGGAHGDAGKKIVVEEKLVGEELSVLAVTDGENYQLLAPSQDHKRLLEGDEGPNTGGMGAYAPAPRGTAELLDAVGKECIAPVLQTLKARGCLFRGVLYAGLMLTVAGPKVLEYNVRFGDPEAQVVLPLLASDAYELFLAAAQGVLPQTPLSVRAGAAVTVVIASEGYPTAPVKGDLIEGIDSANQAEGTYVYHAGTKRDEEGLKTAGGRVLAVTAVAEDLEAAAKQSYAGVKQISWRGQQYRPDIAFRALGKKVGA